jgi:thiamine monophosphate kinase
LAALHGGEDYELILTADERDVPMLEEELGVTVIGGITSGEGVRVLDSSGKELPMKESGYEHFRED